jgi:hypothetical protein
MSSTKRELSQIVATLSHRCLDKYGIQIVIESGEVRIPNSTHFINKRIVQFAISRKTKKERPHTRFWHSSSSDTEPVAAADLGRDTGF